MKQANCPNILYSKRNNQEKEILNKFLLKNKIQFQPIHNSHKNYEAFIQISMTGNKTIKENSSQNPKGPNINLSNSTSLHFNKQQGLEKLDGESAFPQEPKKLLNRTEESTLQILNISKHHPPNSHRLKKEINRNSDLKSIEKNKNVDKETFEKLLTLISMNTNSKNQENKKNKTQLYKENIEGTQKVYEYKNLNESLDLKKSLNLHELELEKVFSKENIKLDNQREFKVKNEENQNKPEGMNQNKKEYGESLINENLKKNQEHVQEDIELICQNLSKLSFDKFSLLEQNESLPCFGNDSSRLALEQTRFRERSSPSNVQVNERNLFSQGTPIDDNRNKQHIKTNKNSFDHFELCDIEEFQRLQTQFDQKTLEFEETPFHPDLKKESEESVHQNDLAYLLNSLSSKIIQTISSNIVTQENEEISSTNSHLPKSKEIIPNQKEQIIQRKSVKDGISSSKKIPKSPQRNNNSDHPIQGTRKLRNSKFVSQTKSAAQLNNKSSNLCEQSIEFQKKNSVERIEKSPVKSCAVLKSNRLVYKNQSPSSELKNNKILSESKDFMGSLDAVKYYQLLLKKATFGPFFHPKREQKKLQADKKV